MRSGDMGEEYTQLIDDSPSPSRSSVSGESSDGPLHEHTQLLYTQLLVLPSVPRVDPYEVPHVDQYGERMGDVGKTQQLDMDMQTQLVDVHNFDDFRKNGGLIGPCGDEASKETQLVHDGEAHSGSSSGKDGEVDSALSPLSASFHRKTSHWLAEFTRMDRTIEGAAGRAPQMSFPSYRDRYLGETQILFDDENGEAHNESAKGQRNLADTTRAGCGGCPEAPNRDGDLPHFLREFDPNRRDYPGQRVAGGWHEVVGQSDDRGWESDVRGLPLVDSDASTEDEEENHGNCVFNTDLSYRGEAQLSQNMNSRSSTRVPSFFCHQDLNKSPEPETLMDDWGEGTRVDLGIGGIDEGGSNVGLLDKPAQNEMGGPPEATAPVADNPREGSIVRRIRATCLSTRTPGSVRAESLRASAVRASSYSSSGRYTRLPQASRSEEVQKGEQETTVETKGVVSQKAGGSVCVNSPISRLSLEKGGSSSAISSNSNRNRDSPRTGNNGLEVEEPMHDGTETKGGLKVDTCRQGGAAGLGIEVSKLGDRNLSSARKLFQGVGNEMDNGVCSTGHKTGQARNGPAVERADEGKQTEVESLPPRENRSSPVEKSLERRSSFGSGLFSTGSDTSYLNLQSPGEESQARALNMVDKLVWLNATGLPHELQQEEIKQPLLARGPVNAKGALQSRPQVAEVKTGMDDPFGVFDWVDSQHDEAGTLFGSAITKANIGKGVSKLSVAPGHCKHICFESKKCGSPPVVGPRTKKMDKLPEKVIKSVPTADKQRGFLSKNPLLATENKLDQQEGRYERDLSNAGATENRWPAGSTGSALALEDSTPNRVRNITEKQSCSSAKGLKNLEALNSTTVDQMRALCSSKVVHQQCSKNTAEQARLEILSEDNGLVREGREATKASNQLLKRAGVQKERVNRIEEELAGKPRTLH